MIAERLDRELEMGATAKPRYKTDMITTDGGFKISVPRWSYPLFTFEFGLEPGIPEDDDDLGAFINLFHCAGGSDQMFRFRHWRDYQATGSLLGYGDGSTKTFDLFKTYRIGAYTRQRRIYLPVTGTVSVYVGAVLQSATVDYDYGQITLASAPPLGYEVTADFEFDLPVRFADDELELTALSDVLDQPVKVIIEEQRIKVPA